MITRPPHFAPQRVPPPSHQVSRRILAKLHHPGCNPNCPMDVLSRYPRVTRPRVRRSPLSLYWTRQSLLLVNTAREMGRRGAREGQGTAAGKVGEGDGMRGRDEMNADDGEKQREESELLRPRKERKG
ncbi:hypothetical protein Pcinc_038166 [Petrolisthes cinctipes]|uniref:Uncharacterized protein n=1 Tax=Petrolisthes cinctipes TaxID=88211 RepID=A0AAE1EKN5_PETCI|nr:hypothetical protein Pcinc_038166 [Petrolisthes cinctipes]